MWFVWRLLYNWSQGRYDGYRNLYTYDDADNLTQVARSFNSGAPTNYYFGYDGKNNRIKRVLGSSTTHYVYADDGTLMNEYTPGAIASGKEYFYLGSQMIASIQPSTPPIANAGSAQTVSGGATVALNGSASFDTDGTIASYTWSLINGAQVTINNATSAIATFTAPQILGTHTQQFRLTVKDEDGEVVETE